MSTIVVATDFSRTADQVLEVAADLAQRLGDRLEIFHVHEASETAGPPVQAAAVPPPSPEQIRQAEAALADRVARVRARKLPCDGRTSLGRPAIEIIARTGQVRPRFVVLGRRGLSGPNHLLIGSVAERVVQESYYPVLVVPDRPESQAEDRAGRPAATAPA